MASGTPGALAKVFVGLMIFSSVVEAQLFNTLTEINACKQWVNSTTVVTEGTSGNKTGVTQYFSNCVDFSAHELKYDLTVAQIASITIDGSKSLATSPNIPMDFLGFAFEYEGAEKLFFNGVPNSAIVNMFRNLNFDGHSITILIGGNSAMHVRLQNSKLRPFMESDVPISDAYFKNLEKLAKITDLKLTFGIPMLTRDNRYPIDFTVNGILKNINPRYIRSIEFGNEPDHWQLYKKCYRKSPNFGFKTFMKEYNVLARDLTAAWPKKVAKVPFQGPGIAGCNTFPKGLLPCWQADLPSFAFSAGPETQYVSYHRYGNSGCSKSSNLRTLMNDPEPGHETKSYKWLENVLKNMEAGIKVLWSEGNAFSCGGNKCLSRTFAVTLWYLHNILEVALLGVDGAFVHAVPHHIYTPFTPIGANSVQVDPVYYSILAFSDLITEPNTKIYKPQTSLDSTLIKVYGIVGPTTHRYCIIHKDPDQRSALTVKLNAEGRATALMTLLTAASPFATEISYAGRQVGSNGQMIGTKRIIQLFAINGQFIFQLSPFSVAMLDVK